MRTRADDGGGGGSQEGAEEAATPAAKRPNLGADAGERKVTAKFLVSNSAAGSVIGKGGVTITEFQTQSQSRIQLSKTKMYFPGTTDRVLLITGSVNAILTALHLMLSKLQLEESGADPDAVAVGGSGSIPVKIAVPNGVCGGLIGKGGSTVKGFIEDSGASIKIQNQDHCPPGVSDRMVTITADTLDQQLRAVALVITQVSEDPNYNVTSTMPVYNQPAPLQPGLGPAPAGSMLPGFAGMGGMPMPPTMANLPPMPPPTQTVGGIPVIGALPVPAAPIAQTTMAVGIPDEHIGALLGRGGGSLREIQNLCGARIQISGRNDFIEDSRNRKVTISGSEQQVQYAQMLITQKVQANAAQLAGAM